MQQKSEKFSEYSERTEFLATSLRQNLSDLPEKIGVSPSMFYSYRTGKHPISAKAWRKLEVAEKAAGIEWDRPDKPPFSDNLPAESNSIVNYSSGEYGGKSSGVEARLLAMENQLRILNAAVASLIQSPPKKSP